MNLERLVKMANQIGDFFESMPDQQQARSEIAAHLRRFWEPRMRRQLIEAVDAGRDAGLKDIVRKSVEQGKSELL
jgi:formate dehydrogenase subunit delta